MIVTRIDRAVQLTPAVDGRYDRVGEFNPRPRVELVLYVRSDIPGG